jgi:hypothetical protein
MRRQSRLEFVNLCFSEVNGEEVDCIPSLSSGETWFRLGEISEDCVSRIKLLSDISETTNLHRFVTNILTLLDEHPFDYERTCIRLPQDGSSAHTAYPD